MASKQITKQAVKTLARAAKPAAKKAAPAVKRTVRKAPAKPAIKFLVADFARPTQGHALAGFTAAWMTLTGILKGAAVPRATLVRIAGETAINYHTRNGNFEKTEQGLKLSAKGVEFFAARGDQAPEIRAGFETIMTTGKLDERAPVKNAKAVMAI